MADDAIRVEREDAVVDDNIQHGIDDNPEGDTAKGAVLGGVGGAAVGAAAGAGGIATGAAGGAALGVPAGPAGMAAGAAIGGLVGAAASAAGVAAVDSVDNDNTMTGIGDEPTLEDENEDTTVVNTTDRDRTTL